MKFETAYLEEFIRTKVELETLTDAQIARLLNVGTSTVSHWRNKFHIKPANKFKRKFQEKYGPDALNSFDILIQHGATLQEIGRYFGFSREYARQVYNKLYQGSSRAQPAILILDSRRIEFRPKFEGSLGFELGFELRFQLKPLNHEVHQVMPAFKHQITGQGSHILKKRLASRQHLTQ